jgi:hypothetical protein
MKIDQLGDWFIIWVPFSFLLPDLVTQLGSLALGSHWN